MSRLRIYGIARTRAFRALWMAHELGLDYEHLPIEIRGADPDAEAYLKLNPNGRLPAIDDDGFILWESLAINLYLATPGNGACGPRTKSSAPSTSGPCTPSACRRRSAIR